MSGSSVRFDRASEYYDSTRALSALAMASTLAQIVPELKQLGPSLEIGVGTGRFALPLADAGVDMVGIDLSRPMLAKLVDKAGGTQPFPLLEGDATRLPFSDSVFGSAVAVHVLHLIGDWGSAIDEILRVVRPGGRLLVDFGGFGTGMWGELQQVFSEASGVSFESIGAPGEAEVDEALQRRGARLRLLEPVLDKKSFPYRMFVRLFEDGVFSFTWRATPDQLKEGGRAVRAELDRRGISIDDMMDYEREVVWRAYDLPDQSFRPPASSSL